MSFSQRRPRVRVELRIKRSYVVPGTVQKEKVRVMFSETKQFRKWSLDDTHRTKHMGDGVFCMEIRLPAKTVMWYKLLVTLVTRPGGEEIAHVEDFSRVLTLGTKPITLEMTYNDPIVRTRYMGSPGTNATPDKVPSFKSTGNLGSKPEAGTRAMEPGLTNTGSCNDGPGIRIEDTESPLSDNHNNTREATKDIGSRGTTDTDSGHNSPGGKRRGLRPRPGTGSSRTRWPSNFKNGMYVPSPGGWELEDYGDFDGYTFHSAEYYAVGDRMFCDIRSPPSSRKPDFTETNVDAEDESEANKDGDVRDARKNEKATVIDSVSGTFETNVDAIIVDRNSEFHRYIARSRPAEPSEVIDARCNIDVQHSPSLQDNTSLQVFPAKHKCSCKRGNEATNDKTSRFHCHTSLSEISLGPNSCFCKCHLSVPKSADDDIQSKSKRMCEPTCDVPETDNNTQYPPMFTIENARLVWVWNKYMDWTDVKEYLTKVAAPFGFGTLVCGAVVGGVVGAFGAYLLLRKK